MSPHDPGAPRGVLSDAPMLSCARPPCPTSRPQGPEVAVPREALVSPQTPQAGRIRGDPRTRPTPGTPPSHSRWAQSSSFSAASSAALQQ